MNKNEKKYADDTTMIPRQSGTSFYALYQIVTTQKSIFRVKKYLNDEQIEILGF